MHRPGSGRLPALLRDLRRGISAARHLRRRPSPVHQPGRPRRREGNAAARFRGRSARHPGRNRRRPLCRSRNRTRNHHTWVGYPDFVTGECVDDGTFGYLSVTIDADPADARTDDLAGDTLGPEWGLHHLDSNIALDDLVAVVADQAKAYAG